MIHIDGSYGEGGGQILRTALSLSAILGIAVRVDHIRAGRTQPGLRPQHVAAVRAVAELCGAQVRGDLVGSQLVVFEPQHAPRSGSYTIDVQHAAQGGSAGSVSLILQAMLPSLAADGRHSQLTLRGGTHVAWSPPFHYLQHVYFPLLERLDIHCDARLLRWGWYPRGGGEIAVTVRHSQNAAWRSGGGRRGLARQPFTFPPANSPEATSDWAKPEQATRSFELVERGPLLRLWGISATSRLPAHIRERMRARAVDSFQQAGLQAEIELVEADSVGPGAGLFLFASYKGHGSQAITAGFCAYGRRGRPSEEVADEATASMLAHHRSGAPVDPYAADQLILPLVMARSMARFRTSALTPHLVTNMWVVRQFHSMRIEIAVEDGSLGEPATVHVHPGSS